MRWSAATYRVCPLICRTGSRKLTATVVLDCEWHCEMKNNRKATTPVDSSYSFVDTSHTAFATFPQSFPALTTSSRPEYHLQKQDQLFDHGCPFLQFR